jgi:hypothetical protein
VDIEVTEPIEARGSGGFVPVLDLVVGQLDFVLPAAKVSQAGGLPVAKLLRLQRIDRNVGMDVDPNVLDRGHVCYERVGHDEDRGVRGVRPRRDVYLRRDAAFANGRHVYRRRTQRRGAGEEADSRAGVGKGRPPDSVWHDTGLGRVYLRVSDIGSTAVIE